jgi:hypothetical protein
MGKWKLWAAALCVVVAAAAVAPVSAASAAIKVKSTVTITTGEGAKFTGKVSSAKKKCRAGRTVKLFREKDSGYGDELVGTAKTNKSGNWTMDGNFFAGEYFARVVAMIVHINGMAYRCTGDFSIRQRY